MLGLQPRDIFAPQRLWQLPLNGLHHYALPATIAERLLEPIELARSARGGADRADRVRHRRLRRRRREHLVRARLLVPRDAAGDDGGGRARLGGDQRARAAAAGRRPDRHRRRLGAQLPARPRRSSVPTSASSSPSATSRATRRVGIDPLDRLRRRLQRFRAVPPVRALIAELDEAESARARGEPVHLGDMIIRLMRVAIQRNTALEEQLAAERDAAMPGARGAARRPGPARARARAAGPAQPRGACRRGALRAHDAAADTCRGSSCAARRAPTASSRASARAREWTEHAKRALIARGWAAADAELRAYGVEPARTGLLTRLAGRRRGLAAERDGTVTIFVPR